MSSARKIIQAAAGNIETAVKPVGIDFDGTNDYLSRSSDLTGNADGKTFTFSGFVYRDQATGCIYEAKDGSQQGLLVYVNSGNLTVLARNSSDSLILNVSVPAPKSTFISFQVSVDLTNSGSRYFIVNDQVVSATWNTYTNDTINFTGSSHTIGSYETGTTKLTGRLAHVFLDYTYRDLSVEANRRLFVNEDLTPASGQSSLSPILYVPMDDPTDPGRNDGTGGDFTLNGTVARSGRGPNQYNSPASTFDGSADYLSRTTALTGSGATKTITLNVNAKLADGQTGALIFNIRESADPNNNGALRFQINSGELQIVARNSSGTLVLNISTSGAGIVDNKWYNLAASIDLSDTGKRALLVDGVSQTLSVSTYTDAFMDLAEAYQAIAAFAPSTVDNPCELSDFWYDDSYLADLTGFYDTETGKPKFLGADGSEPTGSAPLIYLPLRADDAGANKGTGGDFTVTSGPYTGARGPSEFWGESAEFNGTDQYLSRGTLTGVSDGKVLSGAIAFNGDAVSNTVLAGIKDSSGDGFFLQINSSSQLQVSGQYADGTGSFVARGGSTVSTGAWHTVLFSVDQETATVNIIYDGAAESITVSDALEDEAVQLDGGFVGVGAGYNGSSWVAHFDGKIGFVWLNTEFVDFSQEANRLKFFDAFNYPVDLGEDGSTPTGNQPLIYLNEGFKDGTNLGSGGDFTPVNGPTDGGFVKG